MVRSEELEAQVRDPFALRRGPVLRRAPGRETALAHDAAGRAFVVKRYHGSRRAAREARREFENLERLRTLGLAVAEPLAHACRGEEGRVVLRLVRHAETLREHVAHAGSAERRRRASELLALVGRMHAAGWYHRDLYLQHLLLDADGGALVLIDCGRACQRRSPRRRWFVKDLAALLHSTPASVTARERLRFLAGYLDRAGVRGRRARRRFARAVLAKQRRMAAHRPRHGESFPLPREMRPAEARA